jgi:hypothetical protein
MSKMKPYKKAVVVTGTYESGGETKKRYANVGTLFQYDDGGFALKLDTLPVGDGWNGFVSFFDLEDKKEKPAQSSGGTRTAAYDLSDDVPF